MDGFCGTDKEVLKAYKLKKNALVFTLLTSLVLNRLKLCFLVSRNLHSWVKPEKVSKDLINKFNTLEIRKEPLGVVLIIGPWNYPFNTLFAPLIGAIAAGL